MIIHCTDVEQFMDTILECVERGLTFVAHRDRLTINLTGGY